MDLLIFGHAGPPMIVFPSSMGAFFEYEDRGMIDSLAGKLEHGGCSCSASRRSTARVGTTGIPTLAIACGATFSTRTSSSATSSH